MSYYVPQSFSISCGTLYNGAGNNSIDCVVNANDKTANAGEIAVISSAVREAIQRFGQPVEYYINQYNTLSADNLYAEDATKAYYPPVQIIMYVQLTENSATLRRFGFDPDDEITAYVHLSSFAETFSPLLSVYQANNQDIQPKSGDVFQLKQYGNTRPGNREGKFFEVTTIDDQDISEMNYLGGHYMWRLRARRLDYSFEPGLPRIRGDDQVYDNAFSGALSSLSNGTLSALAPAKAYEQDIDETSDNLVYNQKINNTDIYGLYG